METLLNSVSLSYGVGVETIDDRIKIIHVKVTLNSARVDKD